MGDPLQRIAVLADDLTGAAASASCLAGAGFGSDVVWGAGLLPPSRSVCVDMRTRDYSADPRRRARSWARRLTGEGFAHLELRMDSTLRGDPAAGLAGLIDGARLADPLVIAVPAFPSAGRVTVGGMQVASIGGGSSRSVDVAALLFGDECTVVRSTWAAAGASALLCELADRVSGGGRRFVLDAANESDLQMIAAALKVLRRGRRPVVTVSPGAWLRHLAPAHSEQGRAAPQDRSGSRGRPGGSDRPGHHRRLAASVAAGGGPGAFGRAASYVLVVLSSPTDLNRLQLEVLQTRTGAWRYDADDVVAGRAPLEWSPPPVVVVDTIRDGAGGDPWAGSAVAARAAQEVLEQGGARGHACRGIVVGGGRTASTLMDVLGARAIAARGPVAPLCGAGRVVGGAWDGVQLVTKGGLVGGPDTLAQVVASLSEDLPDGRQPDAVTATGASVAAAGRAENGAGPSEVGAGSLRSRREVAGGRR